jgi:hypothetical protein
METPRRSQAVVPLSVMAVEMTLRRTGTEHATVHGFRSPFRDWAGNESHCPRELAEAPSRTSSAKAEQPTAQRTHLCGVKS